MVVISAPSALQDGDEAGVNEFAIHDDGTGAALAFATALLGAGEAKVLAQDVEQALHGRTALRLSVVR
jgi:hypothetical protein